jgi:hypothetical protein
MDSGLDDAVDESHASGEQSLGLLRVALGEYSEIGGGVHRDRPPGHWAAADGGNRESVSH